jgi:23S rRNA (cytosine1962-C5)-methyltransferase
MHDGEVIDTFSLPPLTEEDFARHVWRLSATMNSTPTGLEPALTAALAARSELFDPRHETALRLFNGFYEGWPALVADLYGRTLVLHNYADIPAEADELVAFAARFYADQLPWLNAVLVKARHAGTDDAKRGVLLSGDTTDRFVSENGVWYRIDLRLNQDSSLYLDTRHLREWAKANLNGKTVLNTFAYTGSLGAAAKGGGASRVVQLDLSRAFLNIGKDSYLRNGFGVQTRDFIAADFWPQISRLKRENARFDCVFVDPPLFSKTRHGIVDLVEANARILNKVRPLISDGGTLVTISNALFVSGAAYLQMLETLCADGYLSVEALIPVPQDFIGYAEPDGVALPADPAPFNHPTKIAVLRVRRKEG